MEVSQVVVWFFSISPYAGCRPSQRITEERERSILKYEAVEVRGNSLRNFVIGRSAMLVNASQLSVSNSPRRKGDRLRLCICSDSNR